MSFNLHIRMYSRMHEGSEGYGIALWVHSEHDWQEQSDAPIIVSRFPFRGDEYVCRLRRLPLWCLRHHLRHSVKRVTGFSGRSRSPMNRVPLPPRKRGDNKALSRLYELISASPGPLSFLHLLNLFTEPAAKLSTFPWPCQSYAAGAGIPALPELPGPLLPPPCPA